MAEVLTAQARSVSVTDDTLSVDLADGRTIAVPLDWFPRLVHGTTKERGQWRLIGAGLGIHWPDLDEDISVENLLLGHPSGESQKSLQRWLEARAARKKRNR
jgi:hypothetical protein